VVRLSPLSIEDIELLRHWRNREDIVRYMEFQKHITAQEQRDWFEHLDSQRDHYFIIKWQEQSVGMAHVNMVDETSQSAQVGLFMGEPAFSGTGIALKASLSLLEFAFESLGLMKVWAKVHQSNRVAFEYNKQLGFECYEQVGDFQFMELTLMKFESVQQRLLDLSQAIG
jgi:UDP-4-amino-4,6-dideoxy-N-acetyl-beta-L-altrosamine N-acetyltransferase